MSKYKNLVADFTENSPFEILYQNGLKPNEIKPLIVKDLSPYFTNQDRLERYSTERLIAGWVNFTRLKSNSWALGNSEKCLSLFNAAKENGIQVFSIIAEWIPEINESLTKFWSFRNLSTDLGSLDPHEHLEESLKFVGQILEGIIKSYLKLLVHLNREIRKKPTTKKNVDALKFGILVNELKTTTNFPTLFAPPPWGLTLNQWRNIAYHHNAKLTDNRIYCWYGEEPNVNEVWLTRTELTELVKTVAAIYNVFKNAELIFVFDNLPEYQKACESLGVTDFETRKEALLVELFSGINSQGFKIISYDGGQEETFLTLEDLTLDDATKRAIHSSQFLYQLWLYTSADNVCIEYRLKGGRPFLKSKIEKRICEQIADGTKELSYLAEKVEFEKL
jgi:hypothetical protein